VPPSNTFAATLFITLISACGAGAADPEVELPLRLWYAQPAAKWVEALPIGNGRLGAMVFGGTADERIQFNEDTLWTGQPHDYTHPGAASLLPEIRRLLFEGKQHGAERLTTEGFLSVPVRQKAYQPFGDLRLHFPGHEAATDYHRELDLDSAIAGVTYRVDGVTYRRQTFASHPDGVIVLRLTADQPGRVTFDLKMTSPHKSATIKAIAPDTLAMCGQVEEGGVRFEARLRVFLTGGRVAMNNEGASVENADAAMLVLAAATSFKNFHDITADPAQRCAPTLAGVAEKSFNALLESHLQDHRRLFRRFSLDLGHSDRDRLPTDQRLQRAKADGLETDPALAALFCQYGRYLLIASSRPGGQPANLQGLWNDSLDPPWESKWTTNINCEMNYWPAELTNLSECHEPLFDMIDDLVVTGRHTARVHYACRGWVLHHNTDLWRGTAPINNIGGQWPTGGAWLCHHLWEHYLFTGDSEFLARRAYPVMKEACLFFLDYLVKDPKTGWLVSTPSHSPEQGGLVVGPAMDHQLIRALFDYTAQAAAILNIDSDFAARVAETRRQIAPDQVGRHGQLQEWLEDVDQPNNTHRHMSPLWCLYPGLQVTPDDRRLFDAAKVLLKWRGDGSTGWSYAWRMNLWARAGDGEVAHRQLSLLLARKTLPNLFDLCGPFQIDGNFGAAAGVAEMLLQSHVPAQGRPGVHTIDLLPALPKTWPAGSARGLCARGGFEVDLRWSGGRLAEVTIRSKLGRPCTLRYGGRSVELSTAAGRQYSFDGGLGRTQ